jgi:hypothetical protein
MSPNRCECSIECLEAGRVGSRVNSSRGSVNKAELRQRQEHPTTTHGMDSDHGPFDVPDFWRPSAFSSLSDTPEQTLFTDTHFGESDTLPINSKPILIST